MLKKSTKTNLIHRMISVDDGIRLVLNRNKFLFAITFAR